MRKLGISSLRLFISRWQDFFECRNLKELLIVLKPQITEAKAIPREVTQLVMQYYEAKVSSSMFVLVKENMIVLLECNSQDGDA